MALELHLRGDRQRSAIGVVGWEKTYNLKFPRFAVLTTRCGKNPPVLRPKPPPVGSHLKRALDPSRHVI